MFFQSRHDRHPELRVGVQEFPRPAPGVAARGLMTGQGVAPPSHCCSIEWSLDDFAEEAPA